MSSRVIFDATDSYLLEPFLFNVIRSLYHYISGKSKKYDFSYSSTFKKMLKNSDIIVCASEEQKNTYNIFNKKTIIVLDYFNFEVNFSKLEFKDLDKNEINFFWEGQSHGNINIFLYLRSILKKISYRKINLHIVTDENYCLLGGKNFCFSTKKLLNVLFKGTGINIFFYIWNKKNLNEAAKKSDIGLIPLPKNSRYLNKPENKMVLMWSLGLPVLAEKTVSHSRLLMNLEIDLLSNTTIEWKSKIDRFMKSDKIQSKYIDLINKYLETKYSTDKITRLWDEVINK